MTHQVLAGIVILMILVWFVAEIWRGGGKPENGRDSLTAGGGAMPLW